MAKLKSENCNLQAVSCVLLSFLLIMPGVIDLESIYFSGLDDNTLFSSSDDYLEKPLCVPQDPVEELEWYPNFSDDLISVTELGSEFNSENKLMFLDKAEKQNKKTMENFVPGTTESSGKLAGRISFSENRNQVLCPDLNHENKFELLKAEKSSGKSSRQKPLETEKSSEKSDVGNLFSETEKSLEKSENQNKILTSQSIIKNEPIRVSYPNFSEFMTMDKFKLLKAPEEKKTTIKYLPLKTEKSSGKSPVRKPTSEKSSGKLPLPLQIPDKSLEHPPLRKPFSENTNKLFLSQTNTQSKQTMVLYHENRSGIESESTRLENTLFVNYPKSVRSKTRRLRRHEHLQRFSTEQPKRKCSHCETEKTPQWRNGPFGPKTLCNACGVRYKSGRLLPDYRPAASPTFDAKKHSNYHKRILKKKGLKNF